MISHSVEETIEYGRLFAKSLQGGEVVLLSGDLGAGKTHFTKGVALGLNIEDTVTSPTFTLHNIYYGDKTLNHFDFYRVTEDEAGILGLDEFFGEPNSVCMVEWSENIISYLPRNCIKITIKVLSDNSRSIEIDKNSVNY